MAGIQMNVRIDRGLKESGDAAIKSAGYTPTSFVNLVWGFMAKNRNNCEAMEEILDIIDPLRGKQGDNREELAFRLAQFNEGFAKFCKGKNIPQLNEGAVGLRTSNNGDIRAFAAQTKRGNWG